MIDFNIYELTNPYLFQFIEPIEELDIDELSELFYILWYSRELNPHVAIAQA